MKNINALSRNSHQGFTLIELVVVIVILGILAATAAPKFIDLTGDARASTIQAVRGSVESANTMVHSKALVQGFTTGAQTLDINGTTATTDDISLRNGWPDAETDTWGKILDIELGTNEPFSVIADGTAGSAVIVWYATPNGPYTTTALAIGATDKCFVSFTESSSSTIKPAIDVDTSGC